MARRMSKLKLNATAARTGLAKLAGHQLNAISLAPNPGGRGALLPHGAALNAFLVSGPFEDGVYEDAGGVHLVRIELAKVD